MGWGWGWGLPSCWQGWLVLTAYLVTEWLIAHVLPPSRGLAAFLAASVLATVILFGVLWLKGEPAGAGRWR